MKGSFIIEGHEGHGGGISRVVKAMRRLEGEIVLETGGADPNGLYGHTVIIRTGDVAIRNDSLDCEFDIPFDDDTEANEAQMVAYNLSDATIQAIRTGNPITVTAGYGQDTGIIFAGVISKVRTYRSDLDRVTEIYAVDRAELQERELTSLSYAGGTPASRILGDLVGMVGLPVGVFSLKRDFVFKDSATVDGGLMEGIRHYARICGVSAYLCKGQIYVRSVLDGDQTGFTLSPDTGLLGLSEFEEEQEEFTDKVRGYEMTMLLQHRITTASLLKISSGNVSGTFRVREGSHTYDGSSFLTKVKAIESPAEPPAAQGGA